MSLLEKTIHDYVPVDLKADLDQNWGLPLSFYRGEDALDLDLKSIFRKSWQYFCPAAKVAEPTRWSAMSVTFQLWSSAMKACCTGYEHVPPRGYPSRPRIKTATAWCVSLSAWSIARTANCCLRRMSGRKDFPQDKLSLKLFRFSNGDQRCS